MTKQQVQELVRMIGARLDSESEFLSPQPQILLRDPYDLLTYLDVEQILSDKEIDDLLLEGQARSAMTRTA